MGSNTALRLRRSAAQLHALTQVEREIRATDTKSRCRYLRDFADAFRSYERVLTAPELNQALCSSAILLVGDYHALPASQRFVSSLLELLSASGRPVVLALEAIFARCQHVLDEWMQGSISEDELRERIRFDFVSGTLGRMLGNQLYEAYLSGRVAKRFLRSLFLRKLDRPGAARAIYFAAVRKIRGPAGSRASCDLRLLWMAVVSCGHAGARSPGRYP